MGDTLGYLNADTFMGIANNLKADILNNITPAGMVLFGTLFAISVGISCFMKFRRG